MPGARPGPGPPGAPTARQNHRVRTVLVPGFSQTPTSWATVVTALGPDHEAIALAVPAGLAWDDTVTALAADGGPGCWCGYSMGGRLALAVALARPDLVHHLVLVSATAGIAHPDVAAERRAADERLARRVLEIGTPAFVTEWLAQPLFARVPADAPGVADRGAQDPADLASHLRTLGTGTMPDLWPRLGELTMPVTVVTGRHDAKFTAIAAELVAGCTSTTVRAVALDAGHAVPLERPTELAAILREAATIRG